MVYLIHTAVDERPHYSNFVFSLQLHAIFFSFKDPGKDNCLLSTPEEGKWAGQ